MHVKAEIFALSILGSDSYKLEEFSEELLQNLAQKILSEFERIKALRKQVARGKKALKKADLILLRDYERTLAEKYNWEKLMRKLTVPSEEQPKNLQAFLEIERGVRAKIPALQKSKLKKNL